TSGEFLITRAHHKELTAAHISGIENARTIEDQKLLNSNDHMEIFRRNNYTSNNPRTTDWLKRVRRGEVAVPQVHLDEMRAANVPNLGRDRAAEDKKKLTAEEHMEILRKTNFKPRSSGETNRTYRWLNSVKSGRSTVSRVHLDEMHAANVQGLGNARATEDKKNRTAEEHMEILRKKQFVLTFGGDTQQTYQWFSDVKSGKSAVSQVYLDEMRAANVQGLDNARTTKGLKNRNRTAEEHMEILRKNNFKPSSVGETTQTYEWFRKILAGRIMISQDYLDEMREAGVSGLANARTR
ncbi:hypothetical protein, partial [Streptomyces violaceorubidus]|uniref:hypothetical protein n=1 Tax=Streptomyces violaceorubidus TaxID=284042 RepID=UPI0012FE9861